MDDRNTNKPGPDVDTQLPLDFEEAARIMSGGTVHKSETTQAPEDLETAAIQAGSPENIEIPETAQPYLTGGLTASPAPAPYPPAPQPQPVSYGDTARKHSKTLADELSKSKAPLEISFGPSLREMRESRGISLNEVAEQTKIRKDYLEALEQEDFKRLPPAVFVCGYVRKICELYEVPREVNDGIIRQLKTHADYGLGEDGIEQIIEADHEVPFDADQRTRRILMVSGMALLVLAGVIVVIVVLSLSGRENPPSSVTPGGGPPVVSVFNPDLLKELNPPQVVRMSELPIPEN